MTTRDVIDRYYELANLGEWDAWADLFATDLVMDEQMGGRIEGRSTLRSLVGAFPRTFATFANVPRHVVVDGERGAVVSHISARTHAGVPIEVEVANYFQVTGGHIVYMANFHDSVPFTSVPRRTA